MKPHRLDPFSAVIGIVALGLEAMNFVVVGAVLQSWALFWGLSLGIAFIGIARPLWLSSKGEGFLKEIEKYEQEISDWWNPLLQRNLDRIGYKRRDADIDYNDEGLWLLLRDQLSDRDLPHIHDYYPIHMSVLVEFHAFAAMINHRGMNYFAGLNTDNAKKIFFFASNISFDDFLKHKVLDLERAGVLVRRGEKGTQLKLLKTLHDAGVNVGMEVAAGGQNGK